MLFEEEFTQPCSAWNIHMLDNADTALYREFPFMPW